MSWTICEVKYRPVGKLRSYKISESLDTAQRSSFKVYTTRAAAGRTVRSSNLDRETMLAVQPVDAIRLWETHYRYNTPVVIVSDCKVLRSIYNEVCPRDELFCRLSSHPFEACNSCELSAATNVFVIHSPMGKPCRNIAN